MSERQIGSQGEEAKILELTTLEDGSVIFSVDEKTTSKDVLATLAYVQPNAEIVNAYLDSFLRYGIKRESGNVLSGRRVVVDNSPILPTQNARIERDVIFGENPSFEDVRLTFGAVYGNPEATALAIRCLTLDLIDCGEFAGTKIAASVSNEITKATQNGIEDEMARLTEEFYRGDGPILE